MGREIGLAFSPMSSRSVLIVLALLVTASCRPAAVTIPMRGELGGWTKIGGGATYTVEDGVIVGQARSFTDNTFLCTDEIYDDFDLTVEFKAPSSLNSGVQFRSLSLPEYRGGRVHGYQAEIDVDADRGRWWTAGVYDEARRGWLFPGQAGGDGEEFTRVGETLARPDQWNQMRIEAVGPRIRTWLNGQLRSDFEDDVTSRGMICLQVHGGLWFPAGTEVRWRNLEIKRL